MAFSVTARHSGNSGQTSAETLTTDSATPTADSLLLVGSAAENDTVTTTQVIQAPVGGGWTYTQLAESAQVPWDGSANFAMKGNAWRATVDGSPSAHAITVDHFTSTETAWYCAVAADVIGHDAVSPIVQIAANGSTLGGGNAHQGTVTLAATPAVANLVLVWFFAGADDGGGFAAPTIGGQAMTQVFNQNASFTQAGLWFRVVDGTEANDTITCTDLGQTVGVYTAVAVEIAAAAGGAITQPVNQATETDLAQTLGSAKTKEPGQLVETDTAQPITTAKAQTLTQSVESDTAQPVTALKTHTIGQATESDLAQAVTFTAATPVSQAVETDTAFAITAAKTRTIGLATETDTAQSVTFVAGTPVGQTVETDQAFTITALKTVVLGQAVQTDVALVIGDEFGGVRGLIHGSDDVLGAIETSVATVSGGVTGQGMAAGVVDRPLPVAVAGGIS